MITGQDRAIEQFTSAWATRQLHHAWLLSGARGIGKATFAHAAARRILVDSAGGPSGPGPLDTDDEHRIVRLIEAGSHPDMRRLERLTNDKTANLARNISVDQVRGLGEFLSLTPALSDWRVTIIDTVDELEASGANALLKILEEPPPNSIFFLVSHAPGRLLPTIRSRCRRLDFAKLEDDSMASILTGRAPALTDSERRRIVAMSGGSAGRALAFAELGLAKTEDAALAILRHGDPTNVRRSELASDLGKKGSADRYAAFLELAPSLIAREARKLDGDPRDRALAAYAKARELAAIAPRLSLDPAATIFQLGGILAEIARPASLKP